jgi:hypothetical protein
MNYFTHSAPKSWKPDSQAGLAIEQTLGQRPNWLLQCSSWKARCAGHPKQHFSKKSSSKQFPGTGQLMQLKNLGHFQYPPLACRNRV